MRVNKPLFLRLKQDVCKKCGLRSDLYFDVERESEKCLSCTGETIQVSKIIEVPSGWRNIIEGLRPDLAKFIIE